MKCVILAAGKGTRLLPVTATRPKVMVPVGNKPLLEHVLLQAKQAGFSEFIFVVSSQKESIQSYFSDGTNWDVSIEYIDQGVPMGTAHAIQACQTSVDKQFLVLSGDTLTSYKDIKKISSFKTTTIGITDVDDASEYGAISSKNKRLIRIYEKTDHPPSNSINTGMYLFDDSIFDAIAHTRISQRLEYEITDALNFLADQQSPPRICSIATWVDISKPWDILSANQFILEQMKKSVTDGVVERWATVKGPVSIGTGTRIYSGSYIEGPVSIGKNCKIGPNCYIRPFTSIGDGCHVGNACEIKNSVIMNMSNVPHQNYVGDSIIGEGCNLGSGTKIANLRLDKKTIFVSHQGKKMNTFRRKLGVIMGDNVQTGINARINVGCIIGEESFIGPGAYCFGSIAAKSRIY